MAKVSEIMEMAQAYGEITIDQKQNNRAIVAGKIYKGFKFEALRNALEKAGATRYMQGNKAEGYRFPLNDYKLCE